MEINETPLVRRGTKRDNTNILRNGNSLKRNENIPFVVPETITNVYDELTDQAKQYLAAVISPFSARAVGAVCPYKFKKDVLPATDKISFQFAASDFGTTPSSQAAGEGITGMCFAFLPRCRKAGFNFGKQQFPDQNSAEYATYIPNFPLIPTTDTLVYPAQSQIYGGDAYNILAFGLDSVGRPRIIVPVQGDDPVDVFGAYLIRTTRWANIQSNADALSLLGAGMRINTLAAPINCGGYCFAGSAKAEELHNALFQAAGGTLDLDQWLTTNIEDQYRGKAINGTMVRLQYDKKTLGSKDAQVGTTMTFVANALDVPMIDKSLKKNVKRSSQKRNLYEVKSLHSDEEEKYVMGGETRLNKTGPGLDVNFGDVAIEVTEPSADPADQDLFGVSSLVPIIYWKYENVEADNQYDLVFDAVIHSELTPKQVSPFEATEVERDLMMSFVQEEALTDTEKFPAAHTANSFKSIALHLKKITGAVRDGATKFEKAISLFY
jgi:hypothetical protein